MNATTVSQTQREQSGELKRKKDRAGNDKETKIGGRRRH